MQPRLSELLSRVRAEFAHGPPNGWLRGWDADRGFSDFRSVAEPLESANATSFDYAFCNHFEAEGPLEANDRFAVLTVLSSFVADVYSLHWTVYSARSGRGEPVAEMPAYSEVERRVRRWQKERGFWELPAEQHATLLSGLGLELSGAENVTLGKCLFRDFEGQGRDRRRGSSNRDRIAPID